MFAADLETVTSKLLTLRQPDLALLPALNYNGNAAMAAAAGGNPFNCCLQAVLPVRDTKWLTLPVCPKFLLTKQRKLVAGVSTKDSSHIGEQPEDCNGLECEMAHPEDHVKVDEQMKVIVCFDYVKRDKCHHGNCKYFHPPKHLAEFVLRQGHQTKRVVQTHPPGFENAQLLTQSTNFPSVPEETTRVIKDDPCYSEMHGTAAMSAHNGALYGGSTGNGFSVSDMNTARLSPVRAMPVNPGLLHNSSYQPNSTVGEQAPQASIAGLKRSLDRAITMTNNPLWASNKRATLSAAELCPNENNEFAGLEASATQGSSSGCSSKASTTSNGSASNTPQNMPGQLASTLPATDESAAASLNTEQKLGAMFQVPVDAAAAAIANGQQPAQQPPAQQQQQQQQHALGQLPAFGGAQNFAPCPQSSTLNLAGVPQNIHSAPWQMPSLTGQEACNMLLSGLQGGQSVSPVAGQAHQTQPPHQQSHAQQPTHQHQHQHHQQQHHHQHQQQQQQQAQSQQQQQQLMMYLRAQQNGFGGSVSSQAPLLNLPGGATQMPASGTFLQTALNQGQGFPTQQAFLSAQNAVTQANPFSANVSLAQPNYGGTSAAAAAALNPQAVALASALGLPPMYFLDPLTLATSMNPAALQLAANSLNMQPLQNPVTNVAYMNEKGHLLETLPICRDFKAGKCHRHGECRYVHLVDDSVEVNQGRVTVCRDAAKGRCSRSPCKYFHIPLIAISASRSLALANTQAAAAGAYLNGAYSPQPQQPAHTALINSPLSLPISSATQQPFAGNGSVLFPCDPNSPLM